MASDLPTLDTREFCLVNFCILISNNTVLLVQFVITVEPPVTTTSPKIPKVSIWNLL